jgi:hypothetical protein
LSFNSLGNFSGPLGKLEFVSEVRVLVVGDEAVHALAGGPSLGLNSFTARFGGVPISVQLVLDLLGLMADLGHEGPDSFLAVPGFGESPSP